MTERRGLTIGIVVAILVAGALVDRVGRSSTASGAPVESGPTARAVDGGASTWYCPIANAQAGLAADGTVVIQNTRANAVDGVMTLYGTDTNPVTIALRAPPRSRLAAHEIDFIKSSVVGAVVEMKQGGIAVEQTIAGPQGGEATAPCANRAATSWYVAEGSTALNNNMYLGIFNPFPDDAIVDLEFATDQGRTAPGPFQGLVVAARSVRSVNLGDHVRRRDHVSVTATARRGRIVVGHIQTRSAPRPGLVFGLAASSPSRFWDFPDGVVSDAIGERFNIYNPGKKDASVLLALTLDQGAAEPFEITVKAGDRFTLDAATESRVPKGVGHAATVRSSVPVVVARTLDYATTAPRSGLSYMLGATREAEHWLLPQGAATDAIEEWVVVHNVGRRALRVTITAVTGGRRETIEGLGSVRIGAGQRRSFRMLDVILRPDLPLAIDATRPIVVERVLARAGKPGVSQSIGVPVDD